MTPRTHLSSVPASVSPASADWQLLVDSMIDYGIFLVDPDGCVTTWNRGAEHIEGFTAEEVVGQHISRLYSAEDIAQGRPNRELGFARDLGRYEDEGWRVRKGGGRFWASVIITALFDETRQVRGFGEIVRDLTARRAAEEELRHAEERFHHLVDAVTDYAFFVLDYAGCVQTWNTGAEKTKGYVASEIVGKHFSLFYTLEDRALGRPERLLSAVRRDGRVEDEGWRVRKDGSRFWANVIISAMYNEHRDVIGFAKVTRDLTSRRQSEETERHLFREQAARAVAEAVAKRAEDASRIKDEFLATVSHELRTPLNAIVGWASMLSRRELEPSVSHAIEVIERNARAQVGIVEDILDVSRVITGKLRIDPKPTDLVTLTRQAIEAIRHSALAKQITIKFAPVAPELPLVADPDRLQQVVWNLLSNAVKFTESGGTVRIGLLERASTMVIAVNDTGVGIDANLLPFVFDRFTQADSSTTRRFGGLGLGLALVRHIVELHGGTARADSAGVGRGSTFTVTLPIRAVTSSASGSGAIELNEPAPKLRDARALEGLRVLVVDDDPDANDLVTEILTDAGAIVESAAAAPAAFQALLSFHPHILLSDIGMPGEDGYSLIRRIRSLGADEGGHIPAIALTAYTRSEDRTKALAAGFTTHIGKPVHPVDLVAALTNLAAFARR